MEIPNKVCQRSSRDEAVQPEALVELCMGSSCFSRGNRDVLPELRRFLEGQGLCDRILLKGHLCANSCARGPVMAVGGRVYEGYSPDEALEIVRSWCEGLGNEMGREHGS